MPDRVPGFSQRTILVVEEGAVARLRKECDRLGMTSPGIVIDGALAESTVGQTVGGALEGAPVFARERGEPTLDGVMAFADRLRAAKVDGLVGVGGGSTLDTAKMLRALLATGSRSLSALPDRLPEGVLPLIAVPTTAGTGAEVGAGSFVYDPEIDDKVLIRRPGMAPDVAIADAELTLGLPPDLTAYTGLDALAQAILSYVPATAGSISGATALTALRLLFGNIRTAVDDGANRAARRSMMLGSVMSAMAMFNAPPTYAAEHTFAEPVGSALGIHHGHAVAAFLVPVAAFNKEALRTSYAEIAWALGFVDDRSPESEAAEALIRGLSDLMRDLRVRPLIEVASAWDPEALVRRCKRHDGYNLNPRPISDEDAIAILNAAYTGHAWGWEGCPE